jgi:hypothetical protein
MTGNYEILCTLETSVVFKSCISGKGLVVLCVLTVHIWMYIICTGLKHQITYTSLLYLLLF